MIFFSLAAFLPIPQISGRSSIDISDPGGFAAVAALQRQEILRSYTFMQRATEMLAIAMEDDLR
jgi:hypothetical protein